VGTGADGATGSARSGDDGGARRREGRTGSGRQGYRSGYYGRTLIRWVDKLEQLGLRVPQDRNGRFSTELFEGYQRAERALGRRWRRCTCKASRPAK
jgi:transposase-like protein